MIHPAAGWYQQTMNDRWLENDKLFILDFVERNVRDEFGGMRGAIDRVFFLSTMPTNILHPSPISETKHLHRSMRRPKECERIMWAGEC